MDNNDNIMDNNDNIIILEDYTYTGLYALVNYDKKDQYYIHLNLYI